MDQFSNDFTVFQIKLIKGILDISDINFFIDGWLESLIRANWMTKYGELLNTRGIPRIESPLEIFLLDMKIEEKKKREKEREREKKQCFRQNKPIDDRGF